jgi:hypothetical protein
VTPHEQTYELVAKGELARLRRIEEAARSVVDGWQGGRSSSPLLAAIGALRAALKESPS